MGIISRSVAACREPEDKMDKSILNADSQHAATEHRPESVLSNDSFRLDMFHDQLPLAVPCYDLLPVIEFAVVLY